jgi:hypothetical protein
MRKENQLDFYENKSYIPMNDDCFFNWKGMDAVVQSFLDRGKKTNEKER